MSSQITAKGKGKRPVFLDSPEYPTQLSLILWEDYENPQVAKRNEEITYLANVFDAIKDFKSVLQEYPGWDYIWEKLLLPINEAAEKASDVAVEQAHDPKSRKPFDEVKKVRDLCAVASPKTFNDPFNGNGVITNLVHIITLAETVRLQDHKRQDKAQWDKSIFVAFRRIWARIDRLLPGRAKPTTIGYTQEIDLFGSIGPPVFAVSASGDKEERAIIRRLRISLFSWLGMETEGNNVNWGGGSCSETQNWLTLAPELTNECLRTRRRFFISGTFKVSDVWRQTEASTLFQNVIPFCDNCRALAESLAGYNVFITDGALHPTFKDLREWVRERT